MITRLRMKLNMTKILNYIKNISFFILFVNEIKNLIFISFTNEIKIETFNYIGLLYKINI